MIIHLSSSPFVISISSSLGEGGGELTSVLDSRIKFNRDGGTDNLAQEPRGVGGATCGCVGGAVFRHFGVGWCSVMIVGEKKKGFEAQGGGREGLGGGSWDVTHFFL